MASFLSAFSAGLLTSLTPCVYPLIPITLAVLGTRDATSRLAAFLTSLCYVLGIAATYTILGVIAAQTGAVFGSFLGNMWVQIAISLFLAFLVLYSLELFSLNFLTKLQTVASNVGGKGHGGAFAMGAVSGFVAAPCVGPVLALILGVAASEKDAVKGALLLFTYAMGLGVPFLLLGTFSGLLKNIPKSGNWLSGIKFLVSTALCVFLISNLSHIFPALSVHAAFVQQKVYSTILALVALALAYYSYLGFRPVARVGALLIVSFAAWTLLPGDTTEESWATSIEAGLEQGKREQKVVFVDFFADWCAACKEFNAFTFPDPKVQAELTKLSLVRIDYTSINDANTALAERYEIAGLPCLLFLDPDGNEIPESRITGFMPPDEFVKHLQRHLK